MYELPHFVFPFISWWTFGYFYFWLLWILLLWTLCVSFLYGHMIQFASPLEYFSLFSGSSVFVLAYRGACSSKSLACSSKSSSFLWPYCFLVELDVTSPRTLLRLMWILGGSKRELVKSPRLLDSNLRKGSAIYLSYNVCNWENFEWGEVLLPNPCPVEL